MSEPERRERPEKTLGGLWVVGAAKAGRTAARVARMVVVYILMDCCDCLRWKWIGELWCCVVAV